MTRPVCRHCGDDVAPDAAFCEACGQALTEGGSTAGVRTEPADVLPDRDHYTLQPAAWVAGMCDRGIEHARNEDALALAAQRQPDSHAALVVCDGVTTAANSDVASLAAARAALAVLATPLSRGVGGGTSVHSAVGQLFAQAVQAAQDAVLASADHAGPAGACTFVAAVASGPIVWHASVGDSRAYLFPDDGAPLLLTRDDSMAEMLIDTGMQREQAERTPVAHTITRWLGAQAPDLEPHLASTPVLGPSWLLVCSDGLWNYASAPQDLRAVFRSLQRRVGDDPAALAEALVQFATEQGGHDNITAAVARVGVSEGVRLADDPLA